MSNRRSHPTADNILANMDLCNKSILITGANQGIGFESARALARAGASVTIACRSMANAQLAIDLIRSEKKDAQIDAVHLDLCSLQSVERCAQQLIERNRPLNILILNAAVLLPNRRLTDDGFETTFQVNYLSHFYLQQLLTPLLIANAPSRIVILSSMLHKFVRLPTDSRQWLQLFSPKDGDRTKMTSAWKSYAYSKLANVLFAIEIDRRMHSVGIQSYSVHPGTVSTAISRNISTRLRRLLRCFKSTLISAVIIYISNAPIFFFQQQGAATTVYCATGESLPSGCYWANCRQASSSVNRMIENAKVLWSLSEQMIRTYQEQNATTIIEVSSHD